MTMGHFNLTSKFRLIQINRDHPHEEQASGRSFVLPFWLSLLTMMMMEKESLVPSIGTNIDLPTAEHGPKASS